MVFVPHELPFQVVATVAMEGAGCAAGGGGGGNDDHLTPEDIQKIMKTMSKVTRGQAPAGCHQSDEPASKKAKFWHPDDGIPGLQIALNSLIEEEDRCRHATEQTIPAPAEAGGAGKAHVETPQVAPNQKVKPAPEPKKAAPEPSAAAALHSYPPKGPPPLPVGGSAASAVSAGAAPIQGGSTASSAAAANMAAVPLAPAATTPATGTDQLIQWQLEQLQTQQKLVQQGPIPKNEPPQKADLPATSSATAEAIAKATPQTSATHADASIGVPKAAKSPPPTHGIPVMQPPQTPPPRPWRTPLATAPGAIAPAADGIPSASSFLGRAANDTAGTVPPAMEAAAVTVAAGTVPAGGAAGDAAGGAAGGAAGDAAGDPAGGAAGGAASDAAGNPAGGAADDAPVAAVGNAANWQLPAGAWTGRCVFCLINYFCVEMKS